MEMNEIVLELRELRRDVQALREEIHGYKGFVGGVVWCLSAVAGIVGFIWGVVWAGTDV